MTTVDLTASRWLTRPDPSTEPAPVRMLCLPYAGGGASLYRQWPAALPGTDVVAVQLPGREERITEPAIASIASLVSAVSCVAAASRRRRCCSCRRARRRTSRGCLRRRSRRCRIGCSPGCCRG